MEQQSAFMESFLSDLKLSLQKLTELLSEHGIHFVFIGGAARNEYARARTTEDVDILVSRKDKAKLADLPIGYIRELSRGAMRRFQLHDPKTDVDILFSGDVSGGEGGLIYPEPEKIQKDDSGIPFINRKAFVVFKISSGLYGKGRMFSDYADVVAVIQKSKLKRDFLKDQRDDIVDQYKMLWDAAQEK